jgi:hypothetical protein
MPSGPIPNKDNLLLPWLANFSSKLPTHAAAIPLDAATVAEALKDCAFLSYCISPFVITRKREHEQAVSYKDLIKNGPAGSPLAGIPTISAIPEAPVAVAPGVLSRLRALVQIVKNSKGYNTSMGQDLGIIASGAPAGPEIPTLTLTKSRAGEITFDWNKSGWTGVKIQARAAGTLDWSDLGTDLFSPFVDSRPLATPSTPEVREYRACYLDKETPTLDWSAVLVVTVQP